MPEARHSITAGPVSSRLVQGNSVPMSVKTEVIEPYRSPAGWTVGMKQRPLAPAAVRLLVAVLGAFSLMMLVMATLLLVS
jgi:hypothetical protein